MRILALLPVLTLSACGLQIPLIGARAEPAPSVAQSPGTEDARPTERPGEDVAEATDPAAAAQTGALGSTLATLGDATRAGLWLETPLVAVQTPGRVTADNGNTLDVTLLPASGGPGAGSRMSLQAMQALGLQLTSIAEVEVEAL